MTWAWLLSLALGAGATIEADDFPSLQAALDAHPGRVIHLSNRDYPIERGLIIRSDGTSLVGPGRIVQSRRTDSILRVDSAKGILLEGFTLTRAEGTTDATEDALRLTDCEDVTIRGIRVLDNCSLGAGIRGDRLRRARIVDCDIRNYKTVGVEDRTANPDFGVAFQSILGDGIILTDSEHVTISGNRIVEDRLLSDEPTKEKFGLGKIVEGRQPSKPGPLAPKSGETQLWHQGSAIVVTSPDRTRHVVVTGNVIINAAQGVDIHADQVTFANNSIDDCLIGIKCMHGSRDVIIANNNVSRIALWGLVMMPGSAAYREKESASESESPRKENATAANVVMGNIFSSVGYGRDWHNWRGGGSCRVLTFESGPTDEQPPLVDIVIQGNIVDAGAEETPRFEYSLAIDQKLDRSRFRLSGNVFPAGRQGVANFPFE